MRMRTRTGCRSASAWANVSKGQVAVTIAGVAAWLGLLFALGLSRMNASKAELGEPLFSLGYRGEVIAMIVLTLAQGLLIVALLMERRTRRELESRENAHRIELIHTTRLAIVGQLSASIAHEINQPLGAILSNADAAELMLGTAAPDLGEIRLILADIRKDGLRASNVVRQVETLVRKRPLDFREVDLQDLCADILHFIGPIARQRGVTILSKFDPHRVLVRGDSVLLRQAMLNLLLNAMDALVDVPESQAVLELSVAVSRSGELEIAVRDHGHGVPERYLDQLFDAFFTTKAHGLGLGLPIVSSIIEAHGGRVKAENHPEGGAVFRVTIPATEVATLAP